MVLILKIEYFFAQLVDMCVVWMECYWGSGIGGGRKSLRNMSHMVMICNLEEI